MTGSSRTRRDARRGQDREAEVFSRRLTRLLSSIDDMENQDPEEVEARLRNLTHGAGRP